jgi:hypothetical protein
MTPCTTDRPVRLAHPPKLYRTRGPHRTPQPGDRVRDRLMLHVPGTTYRPVPGETDNYPGASAYGTVVEADARKITVRWDDHITTTVPLDAPITLL